VLNAPNPLLKYSHRSHDGRDTLDLRKKMCCLLKVLYKINIFVGVWENCRSGIVWFPRNVLLYKYIGTRNYVLFRREGQRIVILRLSDGIKIFKIYSGKDKIIATETHEIIINLTGICRMRKKLKYYYHRCYLYNNIIAIGTVNCTYWNHTIVIICRSTICIMQLRQDNNL